ncbi:MAG: outer membrane protein, partial [Neisseriaceae bacterium]
ELNQNMQFWDLSVKGTLPLSDTFALYGQLGGAYGIPGIAAEPSCSTGAACGKLGYNETTFQDAWDFMAGAGVQFNLTKKTAITVGDYYYFGSTQFQGNTNVVLAGLKYNF